MALPELHLREDRRGLLLPVKVVPGASRSRIVGLLDGSLKVAIAAPAEKGQANQALIEFLSDLLNIPRARVCVEQGHGSARKTLRLQGVSRLDLIQKLMK